MMTSRPKSSLSFPIVDPAFGDYPAIIAPAATIDYAGYHRRSAAVARQLRQMGLERGDRLGIFLASLWEYPVLLMACWSAGIVAVPVSTRLPRSEAATLLRKVRCRHLVLSAVQADAADIADFTILHIDALCAPDLPATPFATDLPPIDLQQEATIVFTSGSTGVQKAALHSFGNHFYNALGSNRNLPFQPGDRWLLALPLYHVGGLSILFRAVLGGGAVVIPAPEAPLLAVLAQEKVTHVSLVTTQLYRLLQQPAAITQLGKLKAILLGGSAMPADIIRQAHALGLAIYTSYGMTEMASQTTTTAPHDSLAHLLTSGKILPHRKIMISHDGEILVRGETLFKGYLDGDRLDARRDAEGWFATGDLGRIDSDGYLTVTGRKDNMFVSGGENLQPEEIEAALGQIPGIIAAVVVPVDDAEFGQRPVAFIDMAVHAEIEPAEIVAKLEKSLPRFKIPDRILPWPSELVEKGIKLDRKQFVRLAQKQ